MCLSTFQRRPIFRSAIPPGNSRAKLPRRRARRQSVGKICPLAAKKGRLFQAQRSIFPTKIAIVESPISILFEKTSPFQKSFLSNTGKCLERSAARFKNTRENPTKTHAKPTAVNLKFAVPTQPSNFHQPFTSHHSPPVQCSRHSPNAVTYAADRTRRWPATFKFQHHPAPPRIERGRNAC